MSGKAGQTSNTTSTTVLPGQQQTNVDMLMQGARDQFKTGGPEYYGGKTFADPTQNQLDSRNQATGYAKGVGGEFVDSAMQGDKFFLNPQNIFNPDNIPGFKQAKQGVTNDITRNLTEQILPNIRQGSVATGSLGGSRQGLGEALAVEGTNKQLGNTLANMNMAAYNTGMNQYNQAANRAPSMYGLGLQPAETTGAVGLQEQGDQQRQIDENMARFNFEQLAPLLNLQSLQSLTGSAGQYGGTTTSNGQQTGGGGNNLIPGIGGLLSLISMMG